MQSELRLHGQPIASIFELLGRKENDLTYSLGWALAQSSVLRTALMRLVCGDAKCDVDLEVRLQERIAGGGITDIELIGQTMHVVIEAKRGWVVPTEAQLRLYAPRLRREARRHQMLVAMSECSDQFASLHLPANIDGIPVKHMSWRRVQQIAHGKQGTHAEKRLLHQLRQYLERVVKMQNQESNFVYVVSLGGGRPAWSKLSWKEIVSVRRRYFHPVGGSGWPKEPPNYLAFRFGGQLRSIHHVEGWKVVTDIHTEMPELKPGKWNPTFLYTLGPPILPPKVIKTGDIYPSGRVWAMLDLLLTCDTISEARDKTKLRQSSSD